MLKKTITYKDLDGNDVTEEFYFNLTVAELAEMELHEEAGLSKKLGDIVKGGNNREIIATFKMILETAIGRRSEDGKRFVKDQEARDNFMQTDAYSVLFMELLTNAEAAAQFIVACMPKDLSDKLAGKLPEVMATVQLPSEDTLVASGIANKGSGPAPSDAKEFTFDDFTDEELLKMSDENFNQLLTGLKGKNVPKRVLFISQKRKNIQ